MWFAILGPLLTHDGETPVDVPKGRQRVLLAALMLQAGKPVTADALAEVVWDGSPPSGAAITLRSHVLRLRRVLGPRAGARVLTRPAGYLLEAGNDEVDVLRFRCLCRDGSAAAQAGSWERSLELLGEALDLWRGAPLADVPSEQLRREEARGLEALRLQAEEWRLDAALHLGGHADLVPRLQALTAQHPLREHFHSQLMLALYRSGRQAEAMAVYQRARDLLVEELGTEPGPELSEMHQRILSADRALAVTRSEGPAEVESSHVTPRELPRTVSRFTGRSAELAVLTRMLDQPNELAPEAVVISAIDGTAGVGKTALAVHWAHQVAGRFPDGQLYVNLRGYDPAQPMSVTDALAGFLRSLGVPGADIPPAEDERAARYRSLLADKKVLVVLDNAGSADQVRPLLPGTGACAAVVTSRDALAGLVALDGAARLDLDVLPPAEAVLLLRTLIGRRAEAERDAAAELADQCCRLPLALRVAAELAVSRPTAPLADLTGELADLRTRLDLLGGGGDPRAQVRAVFSWSYRHLGAEHARTYRLLGLHPGPDFEPYAVAAMTGASIAQARRSLDVLARAHLVEPAVPNRYRMHDLLRGYARELTGSLDTSQQRHAALARLFDHYLHTAATAMDVLYPAERHRRPRVPRPATPVPPLPDPAAARDWLDTERATLVAAAGHGWPGHAAGLAATLTRYLRSGGHFPEALTIFTHALGDARETGERAAEATALNLIGDVDWQQGRLQQAADHHRQALALFREVGDRDGEAHALSNLGLGEADLGRYEQAAHAQREAAVISHEIGDHFGEARALGNLGFALRLQGRYQEAAGYYQQSLELFRDIGDRQGEAWALARLGVVDLRLSNYAQAAGYLQQALALLHDMADAGGEAEVLVRLGDVYLGLDRHEEAAGNFARAVAMSRQIGEPILEADALNGLGDALFRTDGGDGSRTHHAQALRLASEAGSPLEQARAHGGLARAYQADGDARQARHHWTQALSRYSTIGSPEADDIRARLARTSDGAADGGSTNPEPGHPDATAGG
jgi:DNA-binding SARP family transcriptional activator